MSKANEYETFCNHVNTMPDRQFNALGANIKKWYATTYPEDTVGTSQIDVYATFYDIVDALYCKRDVYIYLSDSVVRERVFQKISEMTGLEYGTIYEAWLA